MNRLTIHALTKRQPWKNGSGQLRHLRSETNRALIFALTVGIRWNVSTYQPSFPDLIEVKLHSMQTWKHGRPDAVRSSTELRLTRSDAAALAAFLLAAVHEMDQGVGKPL